MSGTVVYAAFKSGDLVEIETIRNSYHGAMHIWRTLAEKYLGKFSVFGDLEALWRLSADPRLTEAERIVHVSTFDYAFVRTENMLELADALDGFTPSTENLRCQAALIRKVHADGARVVAWVQTTVADLAWRGDGTDEDDLDAPFNIDRQSLTGPEVGVGERGGRLGV